MYSLALDSSDKLLVVGLFKDDVLIENISYLAWQKQSEYMVSEIDKALKKHNVSPKDIEEILVTKGPGSYTGLRIALTIAKTYGVVLNVKVYELSSLKVLSKKGETSICLMNARSARSYFGVYKDNEIIEEDKVLSNVEVKEYIENHPEYVVCGDTEYLGIEGYRANIAQRMFELKNKKDEVEDILKLKAVYLKD